MNENAGRRSLMRLRCGEASTRGDPPWLPGMTDPQHVSPKEEWIARIEDLWGQSGYICSKLGRTSGLIFGSDVREHRYERLKWRLLFWTSVQNSGWAISLIKTGLGGGGVGTRNEWPHDQIRKWIMVRSKWSFGVFWMTSSQTRLRKDSEAIGTWRRRRVSACLMHLFWFVLGGRPRCLRKTGRGRKCRHDGLGRRGAWMLWIRSIWGIWKS